MRCRVIAVLAIVAASTALTLNGVAGPASSTRDEAKSRLARSLEELPLYFIENHGQSDLRARYYVQGAETAAYFTPGGLKLGLKDEDGGSRRWNLALDFVGARRTEPEGVDRTAAVVSYFNGPREEWHTALPTYSRVVYRDLWPGIDLEWWGDASHLKYRFVVRAGADPSQIRLRWRGATGLAVVNDRLEVSTAVRTLTDAVPVSYQIVGGRRVVVRTSYVVDGAVYGFDLGPFDRSLSLVIDPEMLLYAGYIGGGDADRGFAIAVDGTGAAYVTGETASNEGSFPATVGPDLGYNGRGSSDWTDDYYDAFVAKVAPDGGSLVYAGYIGGSHTDSGHGIAIDDGGAAYVSGVTRSGGDTFPLAGGPDLTHNGGIADAFVAKVAPDGTSLSYAGYLGGSGWDEGHGIAVDAHGAAYVTGETTSDEATFPVAGGPDTTYNLGSYGGDAFVAKIAPDGRSLSYAGYIGAADDDVGRGIAVDESGAVYVGGETTTVFVFDCCYDAQISDAFVAKVAPDGSSLLYSRYVGAHALGVAARGVAIDADGAAYLVGTANRLSTDEPTLPASLGSDRSYNGGNTDAFLGKVAADGSGFEYAGYIGGAGDDAGFGVAVDASGAAYVTGSTSSTEGTFPVSGGPDVTYNGGYDAFVAKVSPTGTSLAFAGYIGGSGEDRGRAIALDSAGSAYVTGSTSSLEATFPTAVGPDITYNGFVDDAFVAKVGPPPSSPPDTTPPETTITSGPSGTTSSTSTTFEFTASEPSTFECSLDTGGFAACVSPASYTGLGDGSHTFRVQATDASGNTDPTPAEQTWTVGANAPPIAAFTFTCSALTCTIDGSASADADGTIQAYGWDFGDGTSGSGRTTDHTYTQAAAYTVTLTVTDDAGATGTESKAVTLIRLTARGYKVRGLQKVDLSWSGPGGASFDVYRDGERIATVQASSYTDNIDQKGQGSYLYRVCEAGSATCSNEAAVSF